MSSPEWREDLNRLLARFSAVGACPDVDEADLTRLWAVYCGLRRLVGQPVSVNVGSVWRDA